MAPKRPTLLILLLASSLAVACENNQGKGTDRQDKIAASKPSKATKLAKTDGKYKKVVLAAGCFWCLEAIFEAQPGVISAVSGYCGGKKLDPSYKEVCSGTTGHAEAVEVTYDPTKTSFEKLLVPFWKSFDASDGRGVAPDFGSQYRHAIFTLNDAQKAVAEASKKAEQKKYKKPVKTEIVPLTKFYPAEDYHQDFVKNNPKHSYVVNVSIPRMREAGVKLP